MKNNASAVRINSILYQLQKMLQSGAGELCSGALTTSFLIWLGLNTQSISLINFAGNAGNFVASLLIVYAFNWDSSGVKLLKITTIGALLAPVARLLYSAAPGTGLFVLLLLLTFVGATLSSARNSAEVCSTPVLFGGETYVKLMGSSGIYSGLFSFVVVFAAMFLFRDVEDGVFYRLYTGAAAILLILEFAVGLLYKPVYCDQTPSARTAFRLRDMLTREYLSLCLPHLLRGVGMAGASLTTALMLERVKLTQTQNTLLLPIVIVCGIAASAIFLAAVKRFFQGAIICFCYCVSALCMILAPFVSSAAAFFCIYILNIIVTNMANKSVMGVMVSLYTGKRLSVMSSLHILAFSVGFCPTVLLFGWLSGIAPLGTMAVSAIIYVISGILFARLKTRKEKHP